MFTTRGMTINCVSKDMVEGGLTLEMISGVPCGVVVLASQPLTRVE